VYELAKLGLKNTSLNKNTIKNDLKFKIYTYSIMNGMITPGSNATLALTSYTFSPVAYSNSDNIMRFNKLTTRINQLNDIYESLKATTYSIDQNIHNIYNKWVTDNNNDIKASLIYKAYDINTKLIVDRLSRMDNIYKHIEQLEKERDLIVIDEKTDDDETDDEEQSKEQHPRLFGKKDEETDDDINEIDIIYSKCITKIEPVKSDDEHFKKWLYKVNKLHISTTYEQRLLFKYLTPFFYKIDKSGWLINFFLDDYLCDHTIEKLLNVFKNGQVSQFKYKNDCIRENISLRKLDGFFDYSDPNVNQCVNCPNKEDKTTQFRIYNYLNHLYEYKKDVNGHQFILDIMTTIKSGGYGNSSDEIIDCDYQTVMNIIDYLIYYYEDENTYSYINLNSEYIIKAIQDLFLILVFRIMRI
jgi:hypothetical protein